MLKPRYRTLSESLGDFSRMLDGMNKVTPVEKSLAAEMEELERFEHQLVLLDQQIEHAERVVFGSGQQITEAERAEMEREYANAADKHSTGAAFASRARNKAMASANPAMADKFGEIERRLRRKEGEYRKRVKRGIADSVQTNTAMTGLRVLAGIEERVQMPRDPGLAGTTRFVAGYDDMAQPFEEGGGSRRSKDMRQGKGLARIALGKGDSIYARHGLKGGSDKLAADSDHLPREMYKDDGDRSAGAPWVRDLRSIASLAGGHDHLAYKADNAARRAVKKESIEDRLLALHERRTNNREYSEAEKDTDRFPIGSLVRATNPRATPRHTVIGSDDTHYHLQKRNGTQLKLPVKRIHGVNGPRPGNKDESIDKVALRKALADLKKRKGKDKAQWTPEKAATHNKHMQSFAKNLRSAAQTLGREYHDSVDEARTKDQQDAGLNATVARTRENNLDLDSTERGQVRAFRNSEKAGKHGQGSDDAYVKTLKRDIARYRTPEDELARRGRGGAINRARATLRRREIIAANKKAIQADHEDRMRRWDRSKRK